MKRTSVLVLATAAVVAATSLQASCDLLDGAAGGDAIFCYCDTFQDNSTCLQASGPTAYSVQIGISCEGVIHGTCEALGDVGTYDDKRCPDHGTVYAACIQDQVGYKITKYFYSTGPEPYGPDRHDDMESDCSTSVTYY